MNNGFATRVIDTILELLQSNHEEHEMGLGSKSTDKLEVLMDGIQNIPADKMRQVKEMNITWTSVGAGSYGNDYVACPTLSLTFFDGTSEQIK